MRGERGRELLKEENKEKKHRKGNKITKRAKEKGTE